MADRRSATTAGVRVHVIDVGQGDSILLEGPDDDTMLIDSGPEYDTGETVRDYLDEHDIDHLDHLVASHYDADHIGGHAAIIEEFGSDHIGRVHGPDMEGIKLPDTNTMGYFRDTLEYNNIAINELKEGSDLYLDNVDIDVLNLSPDNDSNDINENSVVMQATYGEQSVLLGGDISHETEVQLVDKYSEQLDRVDMYNVPHHGADGGMSPEIMMTCDPEVACFSHGENNENDHPTRKTLAQTHITDTEAVSTVVHGSTTFGFDGAETMAVEHERDVESRDVADVTTMIHVARAHGREQLDAAVGLDAADLPETAPTWAEDAAIFDPKKRIDETAAPAEQVHTAITESETVEEVRQTLDKYPDATDHLREVVQADRDEFVTTVEDVQQNKQAYNAAKSAESTSTPSVRERVSSILPLTNNTSTNGQEVEHTDPASEIDGPIDPETLPKAVRERSATGQRVFGIPLTDAQIAAEETADAAVADAETVGELCWGLQQTSGAHKEFLDATDKKKVQQAERTAAVEQAAAEARRNNKNRGKDNSIE